MMQASKETRFTPSAVSTAIRLRRFEFPHALQRRHLALFRQGYQALGQAADHRILPAAQLVDVDLRLAECDARVRHLLGLGHHLGRMQQRLGRNAADVEAYPAQRRVALDQHDFLAQVGRAKGRGIAARARAQHHDLGVQIGAGPRRRRSRRRCVRRNSRGCGAVLGRCRAARQRRPRCRLRRRRSGSGFGSLQQHDQRALGHLVADLELQFLHHAGRRRRNFHRRLVRFHGDERGLFLHRVARFDQDLDDIDILEVADVRDFDLDRVVHAIPRFSLMMCTCWDAA